MTQDDIIRVAVQCQLVTSGNRDGVYMDALTKFADTVAVAEREACADICDLQMEISEINKYVAIGAGNCADAIRARGNK